jgi:hypothetical protein
MADNRIQFTFELQDKGKVKVEQLGKTFKNLDRAIIGATKSLKEQAKTLTEVETGNKKLISDAGLAGATLTEFGRTISDANYGIRGMANNLSQLSSLFVTLVSKEGGGINGVSAAFSRLGQQLIGPLGIILAFQALIALFEKFDMDAEKAARAANKQTEAFSQQRKILLALTKNTREYNISGEALKEEISLLTKESQAFKTAFEDLNDFSDENVRNLVEDYGRMLELEDARIDLVTKAEEEAKKSGKQVVINSRELKDILKELNPLQEKFSTKTKKVRDDFEDISDFAVSLEEALARVQAFDPNAINYLTEIEQFYQENEEELSSLTAAIFGLTADARQKELLAFSSKFQDFTRETELYKEGIRIINEKYDKIEEERLKRQQRAEQIARFNHYKTLLKGVADFFQASAELNEQNKALARSAIIASSAAASVGVWQSYHSLEASPKGFLATAGAVAAQLAIVAQTASALKSLNSGSPVGQAGGAGAGSSQAPIFNVVGQSNVDQIGRSIATARQEPLRAYVVESDITNAQQLENARIQQASIG